MQLKFENLWLSWQIGGDERRASSVGVVGHLLNLFGALLLVAHRFFAILLLLVKVGKVIYNDGYGQGDHDDAAYAAERADQLSRGCARHLQFNRMIFRKCWDKCKYIRVYLYHIAVADCGDRYEGPPLQEYYQIKIEHIKPKKGF